eukprot:CAMPEP_0181205240 /NCGR_PEP_ID=MMETSP1096-20121128/20367_1 /TAXON_ID=156174 ORGANISM="Chrysochromulina ericina, Strain CCMP281" /NCGR_SAMPLE_ID=MMETSP1096 /ASSEMBLY_ACC=CAM_ASM_000453 /LENGTH=57 /DNA_ID=CAMNT_0023296001 /DNA_START=635 /DNA_END=807 /DNA_ORIENTATION=+
MTSDGVIIGGSAAQSQQLQSASMIADPTNRVLAHETATLKRQRDQALKTWQLLGHAL